MREITSRVSSFQEIIDRLTPEQLQSCFDGNIFVVQRALSLGLGEEVFSLKKLGREAGYAPNSLRTMRARKSLPGIRIFVDEDDKTGIWFMRKSDLKSFQTEPQQGRGRRRRQTLPSDQGL